MATKTWDTWATQRAISDEEWSIAEKTHLSRVKIDKMTEKSLTIGFLDLFLKFGKKW